MFKFRYPVLLAALAAVYPALGVAAGGARVDFAVGNVVALASNGASRPLGRGAAIGSGDTVRTGSDGRVQLRFDDGALVSLQPQTEFRIDDYHFAGRNDGKEKGFFSLLKGGLRTITGLIGKGSGGDERYRVSTQVATIGIRGTGYSAAYTDASNQGLLVNTSEGKIEVCNAGGCVQVASGESAYVGGRTSAPVRTDSKPVLLPAQPSVAGNMLVATATGESRTPQGGVAPLSTPLVSGSNYYVAHAGTKGGSPYQDIAYTGVNATFDNYSQLTGFTSSGDSFSATNIAGGFSVAGVIGWGKWTDGVYNSSTPLKEYHYVVGLPTASADINTLSMSTTYQLVGFTSPTASNGATTGAPSATLNASFAGGYATLSMGISVPVGGTVISDTLTGSNMGPGVPKFSMSSSTSSAEGFFAGSNASYAGLTYQLGNGGPVTVTGAAVFRR